MCLVSFICLVWYLEMTAQSPSCCDLMCSHCVVFNTRHWNTFNWSTTAHPPETVCAGIAGKVCWFVCYAYHCPGKRILWYICQIVFTIVTCPEVMKIAGSVFLILILHSTAAKHPKPVLLLLMQIFLAWLYPLSQILSSFWQADWQMPDANSWLQIFCPSNMWPRSFLV